MNVLEIPNNRINNVIDLISYVKEFTCIPDKELNLWHVYLTEETFLDETYAKLHKKNKKQI